MSMTENEISKIDSAVETARAHVERNKRRYLIGGAIAGVALVGVGGYILGARTTPKNVETLIQPQNVINGIAYKPNMKLEVVVEALGDPGNIIQDLTTGTIYASQRQAAREIGVEAGRISEHLKGAREHVNGHKLVKLGKAHVTADVA